MEAGRLTQRAALQSALETRDDAGGVIRTWRTLATRWVRVQPLSARERLYAGQVAAEVTHKITLRHYSGLEANDRVVIGARIFEIQGVIDPAEDGREMLLLAVEREPLSGMTTGTGSGSGSASGSGTGTGAGPTGTGSGSGSGAGTGSAP